MSPGPLTDFALDRSTGQKFQEKQQTKRRFTLISQPDHFWKQLSGGKLLVSKISKIWATLVLRLLFWGFGFRGVTLPGG